MTNTWRLVPRLSGVLLILLAASLTPSARGADEPIPLELDSNDPKLTKIVVVAGAFGERSPLHQYYAGSIVLMKLLEQTPNVHVVLARDGWPKNPAIFENAKAIVFYMDGGKDNPLLAPGRLETIEKAVAGGAGFVGLHNAAELPRAEGLRLMKFHGAYYDLTASYKGHWDAVAHDFPQHPTTRGVKPFTLNDGWHIDLCFVPGMKGITPLLFAPVANKARKSNADPQTQPPGSENVTAWVYEREDGVRSFGMTGCHSHRYFADEGVRKLVVNGILWTAKVEIPPGGAKVELEPMDLDKNVEGKPK